MLNLDHSIRLTVLLAFIALLASMSLALASSGLAVSDAWIRHVPPVMKVQAGYATVSNKGSAPQAIIGAESPDFTKIELHTSRVENGVAIMEAVKRIEIPQGGKVAFAPGGLHLMLHKPKEALNVGASVPISLILETGEKVAFTAQIKKDAMRGSHHGGMKMSN